MRKVVFRVDAGGELGFGHAVRSISVARYLKEFFEIESLFVSRYHPKLEEKYTHGKIDHCFTCEVAEETILNEIRMNYSGQVLFIDKLYPYSRETIQSINQNLHVIMFHNDCDGMFESDYAIFPAAHLPSALINSDRWKDSSANLLYGPDYVIINDTVKRFLSQQTVRVGQIQSMAITTGSSDPKGMLLQLIRWLNESDVVVNVNALVGFDFSGRRELNKLMPFLKPSINVRNFNFTDLFAAKLAVAAFGVTAYELIYAGVPLLTIGHIPKNALGSRILQKRYGCNHHLGWLEKLTKAEFISAVRRLWYDPGALSAMQQKQSGLIDGNGLSRIGNILYDLCKERIYSLPIA